MPRMSVRSALSEPLVQFAIGGALLFAAQRWLHEPRPRVVVVVSSAAAAGDVDARIDEALLVADARARGLDRDDVIVRRRLAQKVRFAWEGAVDPDGIDDDALARFRDADPARYEVPARVSFTQVFVDPGRHDDPAATADAWREALTADEAARVGDPFALGRSFGLASAATHAGRFGDAFADALGRAPLHEWTVVPSALGWHVVRVDATEGARVPEVAQIRERLSADALAARRDAVVRQRLAQLRAQYDVEVVVAEEG